MHGQDVDNSCLQVVQNEDKLHQKEKTEALATRKKVYISHNNSAFVTDTLLPHFSFPDVPLLSPTSRLPAVLQDLPLGQDDTALNGSVKLNLCLKSVSSQPFIWELQYTQSSQLGF